MKEVVVKMADQHLVEVSVNLMKECLGVKQNEQLLVIGDDQKKEIAEALYEAGKHLAAESLLMLMKPRQKSGEEPPLPVAEAMKQADVVICATEHSLTHTNARKNAAAAGARVATMPGITLDMFSEGAITADYGKVKEVTNKVTKVLDSGSRVKIVKDGRELTFSIEGRPGVASTGVHLNPGDSGNLPSGEGYIAPVEGTASGQIVVDGSVAGIGKIDSPLLLTVEKGRLVEAEGAEGAVGKELLAMLGEEDGRQLGEFGVGTNDKARITGIVLEDEKVYGTIHVAFGSNLTFGGTIEAGVHIDLVVNHPDVYIDDQKLLEQGHLVI
jgi:leucyl aminopeptidase (aminopeptidase T)